MRPGPVHPRSRGEHRDSGPSGERACGSSPLARGTRGRADPGQAARRFIPARAGNTGAAPAQRRRSPVHPRSRGEHLAIIVTMAGYRGSSPLARGTQPALHRVPDGHRFIPARAGNTPGRASSTRCPSVHPRSRGEHVRPGGGLRRVHGSSPLARGTRSAVRGSDRRLRFIPARAGNTSAAPSCGPGANGSSPLARGTPRRGPARPGPKRFIPARAGNTARSRGASRCSAVHPRSRGEHEAARRALVAFAGSSPLARGTPRDSSAT